MVECWSGLPPKWFESYNPEISSKCIDELLSFYFKKSRLGIDFIIGLFELNSFLKPIVAPSLDGPGKPICLEAWVILVYVGFLTSLCSSVELLPIRPKLALLSYLS